MHAVIKEVISNREIMHFADKNLKISSFANKIFVETEESKFKIETPENSFINRLLSINRLSRRALRLDKCNVFTIANSLIIIRSGRVWCYYGQDKIIKETLKLENCRNILHQSMAISSDNRIYFGEYGSNRQQKEMPIYMSKNQGKDWSKIFIFPPGKIKHIHGCHWDPYEERIWVFTGDSEGECWILVADREFKNIEWLGNGSQVYRACNAFFEKDHVHWLMDSPIENSYHIRFDRKDRKIQKMTQFPGPVWYIKRLMDGYYLAATACEIGPSVTTRYAHLFCSNDLKEWIEVLRLKKDNLPKKLFKFGVIGFADGEQSSKHFYIFTEGLEGFDGKVAICNIVDQAT
jgi:hypothetical protein